METKPTRKLNWLDQWILDHPYFSTAIAAHVALLVLALHFYQLLLPNTTTPAEKALAEHYSEQSRLQAARQRLDDMEAVKQMLDQLSDDADKAQTPNSASSTETKPEAVSSSQGENAETKPNAKSSLDPQPSAAPSMEDMLSQSQQLLKEVKQVHDQVLKQKLDVIADAQTPQADTQAEPETEQSKQQAIENAEQAPPSQEELAREIADNQLQVRRMFEQIVRSEQAKQSGNPVSDAAGRGQGSQGEGEGENQLAKGSGQGSGQRAGWFSDRLDPNNPLSVENHFNKLAGGITRDLAADMQAMYNLQGYTANKDELDRQLVGLSREARTRSAYSRKITTQGISNRSVVINGWYFIGPFPNPDRVNIHTRFPPEIGVDLNAVYLGDQDRLLRWQFIQYDHLPIIPPDFTDFAIYYASTEVYSDITRDVWLEIGSDDQSQLWVNDILVWRSSDDMRPWQEDQGTRKVRLKAGRNTLLFRLENGVQRAAFSVIVSAAH